MAKLTLEQKMGTILCNTAKKLNKSEMKEKDYGHFIFAQLSEQEILIGGYDQDNVRAVGEIGERLIRKISSEKLTGIEDNYYRLKSAQLSEQASEDVNGYKTLVKNTVEHVRESLNGEKAHSDTVSKLATDYINSQTGEIGLQRQGYIFGTMSHKLEEFKMRITLPQRDKNELMGNYRRHEIQSALEKL